MYKCARHGPDKRGGNSIRFTPRYAAVKRIQPVEPREVRLTEPSARSQVNRYRTWLSKLSRSSIGNAHMGAGAIDRHESATCELTSASAVEADLMGYFEGSRVVGASVAGEGGTVLPANASALFCCCILASRFACLRIRCCSLIFSRFLHL